MATYPEFAAGQRLTATLLRALQPDYYYKASATTRNNTAALAADPDLQGIALAVGVYHIKLLGFHTQANTTPKLKTRWIFSGTWSSFVRACQGPGSAQTGAPSAVTDGTSSGYGGDSQDAVYSTSTSGAYSVFTEEAFNVSVTVAGTMALHWAQNVATAADTILRQGTGFMIRQIG